MSIIKVDYGTVSGGGGITEATATAQTGISSYTGVIPDGSGNTSLCGFFTVGSQMNTNSVLLKVSPVPKQEVDTYIYMGSFNSGNTRTVKLKTNGDLVLTGTYIASGYTWYIDTYYNA